MAEQALVFLGEGNSTMDCLDCKASQSFRGFLPQTFMPVARSDERSTFIPIPRVWQISVTVAALGAQRTDKPLQLLILIPPEPSSAESSASLLTQNPLSAALHPQPSTPRNSTYFTLISSNCKALLTRMTDFITHYYTIPVFSSPNKKKVQKKRLFEFKKKKKIPLITNDLFLRKNFDAKTQLLLNSPVWFKLFPCLTSNKCHMK